MPRYSQMVHRGSYTQYGGGGEAWCSPTSLTMVLAYYDALPPPSTYSWVRDGHPDREVVHVARATYDTSYGGTGTWPFNTAYAASQTGSAFVTRLRNLREAERFIAAGIPLVASVRFGAGELSGSPISSTNGHLMVVVGFTDDGDVVVNDPAASGSSGVRRTYDRGQFEDVWLRRNASGSGGSGGLVYVVNDAAHPLPNRTGPAQLVSLSGARTGLDGALADGAGAARRGPTAATPRPAGPAGSARHGGRDRRDRGRHDRADGPRATGRGGHVAPRRRRVTALDDEWGEELHGILLGFDTIKDVTPVSRLAQPVNCECWCRLRPIEERDERDGPASTRGPAPDRGGARLREHDRPRDRRRRPGLTGRPGPLPARRGPSDHPPPRPAVGQRRRTWRWPCGSGPACAPPWSRTTAAPSGPCPTWRTPSPSCPSA